MAHPQRVLVLDNFDSFTHNACDQLAQLGAQVEVRRNDAVDVEAVRAARYAAIVLSPGPGRPRLCRDSRAPDPGPGTERSPPGHLSGPAGHGGGLRGACGASAAPPARPGDGDAPPGRGFAGGLALALPGGSLSLARRGPRPAAVRASTSLAGARRARSWPCATTPIPSRGCSSIPRATSHRRARASSRPFSGGRASPPGDAASVRR